MLILVTLGVVIRDEDTGTGRRNSTGIVEKQETRGVFRGKMFFISGRGAAIVPWMVEVGRLCLECRWTGKWKDTEGTNVSTCKRMNCDPLLKSRRSDPAV